MSDLAPRESWRCGGYGACSEDRIYCCGDFGLLCAALAFREAARRSSTMALFNSLSMISSVVSLDMPYLCSFDTVATDQVCTSL